MALTGSIEPNRSDKVTASVPRSERLGALLVGKNENRYLHRRWRSGPDRGRGDAAACVVVFHMEIEVPDRQMVDEGEESRVQRQEKAAALRGQ
jgi:hypothetical protein